ncbi:MAG: hypothetical protein KDK71_06205, partial [Chlamydiia bacterium]|nr:hypothetical protein [Chlamydiia bacterium]
PTEVEPLPREEIKFEYPISKTPEIEKNERLFQELIGDAFNAHTTQIKPESVEIWTGHGTIATPDNVKEKVEFEGESAYETPVDIDHVLSELEAMLNDDVFIHEASPKVEEKQGLLWAIKFLFLLLISLILEPFIGADRANRLLVDDSNESDEMELSLIGEKIEPYTFQSGKSFPLQNLYPSGYSKHLFSDSSDLTNYQFLKTERERLKNELHDVARELAELKGITITEAYRYLSGLNTDEVANSIHDVADDFEEFKGDVTAVASSLFDSFVSLVDPKGELQTTIKEELNNDTVRAIHRARKGIARDAHDLIDPEGKLEAMELPDFPTTRALELIEKGKKLFEEESKTTKALGKSWSAINNKTANLYDFSYTLDGQFDLLLDERLPYTLTIGNDRVALGGEHEREYFKGKMPPRLKYDLAEQLADWSGNPITEGRDERTFDEESLDGKAQLILTQLAEKPLISMTPEEQDAADQNGVSFHVRPGTHSVTLAANKTIVSTKEVALSQQGFPEKTLIVVETVDLSTDALKVFRIIMTLG